MTPRVSVIMPVYNAGPALRQAVGSILSQSMGDFELVMVDDCSTDGCISFVESLDDPRVRLVRNEVNQGAAPSRNRAIGLARAPIIAIADADDIAHPFRLARQSDFLDEHDHVSLVAGSTVVFDDVGEVSRLSTPVTTHEALTLGLRYGPSFFHGSVSVRREALNAVGGYRDVPPAEDYDMYARLLLSGHRLAAIPDVVLFYREHPGGISKERSADARAVHERTSHLVQSNVDMPSAGALVRAVRAEPVDARGEPRLRLLKLLGRTALEFRRSDRRVALRCALASACAGPSAWTRLASHGLRNGRSIDVGEPS